MRGLVLKLTKMPELLVTVGGGAGGGGDGGAEGSRKTSNAHLTGTTTVTSLTVPRATICPSPYPSLLESAECYESRGRGELKLGRWWWKQAKRPHTAGATRLSIVVM